MHLMLQRDGDKAGTTLPRAAWLRRLITKEKLRRRMDASHGQADGQAHIACIVFVDTSQLLYPTWKYVPGIMCPHMCVTSCCTRLQADHGLLKRTGAVKWLQVAMRNLKRGESWECRMTHVFKRRLHACNGTDSQCERSHVSEV